MGIVKDYSRRVADAGRIDNVESIAAAGALKNFGLSVLTSTSTGTYNLGAPVAGLRKTVAVTGSTAAATVDGNGATINGSTSLALGPSDAVELVGLSTGAWAIVALSTS